MRTRYDDELGKLGGELQRMGALCEQAIAAASKALDANGEELRRAVFEADDEIDRMERDVETLCLRLLLRQQPVAADLRFISSALKLISDLERIGDQAADIAELSQYISGVEDRPEALTGMARAAVGMVSDSVRAYTGRDLALAREVIDRDDTVDDLFNQVKTELTALIAKEPGDSGRWLDLLMVAKYFERIADHATNVAEWAEFAVTGTHPRTAEKRG